MNEPSVDLIQKPCRKCGRMFFPTLYHFVNYSWVCPSCKAKIPYFKSERHKELARQRERKYRQDPETRQKEKARRKVRHEIKMGRMARGPCALCGDPQTQAHHSDYTKPLEVTWLCHEHHRRSHVQDWVGRRKTHIEKKHRKRKTIPMRTFYVHLDGSGTVSKRKPTNTPYRTARAHSIYDLR